MHTNVTPVQLSISTIETPIGGLTIVSEQDHIIICEFTDHKDRVSRQLRRHYKEASITHTTPISDVFKESFQAYFEGKITALDTLQTKPAGTQFQKQVWSELREIPAGATTHYGALAQNIGTSARAVGGANGRNPIALIHPCHRVIGADGSLTGYAGGLERKEWLLQHEGQADGLF